MDTTALPFVKRQRLETPHNDAVPQPKHGEPWFADGNIILQAELTQYRVYRGVLADSSEIFADMLSLSQPAQAVGDVERCPVVELSDLAKDWHYVLKALFQRSYVSASTKALPVPVVAAFLRLGKKYNFQGLTTDATERLKYECPSSIVEWDARIPRSMIEINNLADHVDVAILARETSILPILPIALLRCIDYRDVFDHLLTGHERDNGSISILSGDDQRVCLVAWHKIVQLQANTTYAWLNISCDDCADHLGCSSGKMFLRSQIHGVVPCCGDIFADWREDWEDLMCEACVSDAKGSHCRGRRLAWDQLPIMFGLPEWDQLISN